MGKILFLILFIFLNHLNAKTQEKYYQNFICKKLKGKKEVRVGSYAKVDCLTKTTAWEVDFAPKVYEAIGQALFYSTATRTTPGVVLIVERPKRDIRYVKKILEVKKRYKIKLILINSNLKIKKF